MAMQKFNKHVRLLTALAAITLFVPTGESYAGEIQKAPGQIQAAIFVKVLSFNEGISSGGDISVHVISAPGFAAEMKSVTGEKIGQSSLAVVNESDDLPLNKPSAVYIGDESKLDEILRYTREHKILSITGIPELVAKGVTLGVGISGGKPQILLNLSSSKDEAISWNYAILKVSTTFE